MKLRWFAGVVVVAVLAGLGTWAWQATAPPAVTPAPASSGSRVRPQGGVYVQPAPALTSLNPFTTQDQVVLRSVLPHTHDRLLELDDATGTVRGELAGQWRPLDDGERWEVTLRDGLVFSDGTPCGADDVVFTFAAARSPGVPLGALRRAVDLLEGVEAVDRTTLHVTVTDDTAQAFDIALSELPVLSERWWRREIARRAQAAGMPTPEPGDDAFAALLAQVDTPGPGTGPYALPLRSDGTPTWRPGEDLELVRNARSWHRNAEPASWNLDALRFRVLPDRAAQMVALRRREIDWMGTPDPHALLDEQPELARDYRPLVYDSVALGAFMVFWNTRREGLTDARVRMALAHLFDRDGIVRLLAGNARPAGAWCKAHTPGHPDDVAPVPFDVEVARTLLQQAGFGPDHPLRLRLLYAAGDPFHRQVVDLAQPAFARAGVDLVLEPADRSVLLARGAAHDFDGVLLYVSRDRWPDPYRYFHSSQIEGGRNWMGFSDAEVDRLCEAVRRTRDVATRNRLLQDLCRRLALQQPMAMLVDPLVAIVFHRRFRDAEPGPDGLDPKDWWVPPELRR